MLFFSATFHGHLKSKGHKIIGYVIMPNHVHVLIDFIKTHQSINMIIGNGKRFMAFGIVKRLKSSGKNDVLLFCQKTWKQKGKPIINSMKCGNYRLTGNIVIVTTL